MKLNDTTEIHDSISNATIARIRNGKHIIIDWETNLMHVMRREFLETDKCEFTLSKSILRSQDAWIIIRRFFR